MPGKLLQIVMALRPSRRLRGLAPGESRLEQVCFICQRGINIGSLSRFQRTSLCSVFMHRTCHRQMVTRLPTCGNCRGRNDEFQREVVLETDEEVVVRRRRRSKKKCCLHLTGEESKWCFSLGIMSFYARYLELLELQANSDK